MVKRITIAVPRVSLEVYLLLLQGLNNVGQFGNGLSSQNTFLPDNRSTSTWGKLSQSTNMACGIRAGRLLCWGLNSAGVLGRASATDPYTPQEVDGGGEWIDVFSNYYHACGIRSNGTLACWVRWGSQGPGRRCGGRAGALR